MYGFAELLRRWRTTRRYSQLELALEANVSARHISFLETGRAKPSREMIARLGDALHVPLAERNSMLTHAGYAAQYLQREWDAEAMAPIRTAIEHMLDGHEPYPAIVLDRAWTIVRANRAGLALFGPLGMKEGDSLVDVMLSAQTRKLVENWPEVAHHVAHRLRTESHAQGGVPVLDEAAEQLSAVHWDHRPPSSPVTVAHYLFAGSRISLFSTIAQFGTPVDLTLDDLRIELFFPADEQSRKFFGGDGSD